MPIWRELYEMASANYSFEAFVERLRQRALLEDEQLARDAEIEAELDAVAEGG